MDAANVEQKRTWLNISRNLLSRYEDDSTVLSSEL